MAKRILVGLAALVIVAGISSRFSTVPTDDSRSKSVADVAPKVAAQPVDPSGVPSEAAPEITPTPPTPAEQANYQDAVMVRRYLDAFDECTDRAVVRGADYAFALCSHLIAKAKAYSDRAGLGYQPTQKDVMATIQRKILERYGSAPPPVIRDQSPFAY